MKYEWRKQEKEVYLPPNKPVIIDVPKYKFLIIRGKGNPNSAFFGECIEALYAVSYAIRMSYKNGCEPEDFYQYTVYPLEGIWDISEKAKQSFNGKINKDDLVFELMIRQPDFVTNTFAETAKEWALKKKGNQLINQLVFEEVTDGKCIQMMHLGSYDDEPVSFATMEEFCKMNNFRRKSRQHREIYISDPRKVDPEKLKTVLRYEIE